MFNVIHRHSRKRTAPVNDKYKAEKEYWMAKKEKHPAEAEEKPDSLLFPTIASCTSSENEEVKVKVGHKHRHHHHRHHKHKSYLLCSGNN